MNKQVNKDERKKKAGWKEGVGFMVYWCIIYLLLAKGSPELRRYQGLSKCRQMSLFSFHLSALFPFSATAHGFALPCCREEMEHGSDSFWLYHLSLGTSVSSCKAWNKGPRERLTGSAQCMNTFLTDLCGHIDEDYGWPRLDLMFISVDWRLVWQPIKTTGRKGGSSYPKWDKTLYRKKVGEGVLTGTAVSCPLQIFYVSRSRFVFQQMSLKIEKTFIIAKKKNCWRKEEKMCRRQEVGE